MPSGATASRASTGPKPIQPPKARTATNSAPVTARLRRTRRTARSRSSSVSSVVTTFTSPPRLSVKTSAMAMATMATSGSARRAACSRSSRTDSRAASEGVRPPSRPRASMKPSPRATSIANHAAKWSGFTNVPLTRAGNACPRSRVSADSPVR